MVSAGVLAMILYSPGCPYSMIIANDFIKGLLMGITMEITAIAIIPELNLLTKPFAREIEFR